MSRGEPIVWIAFVGSAVMMLVPHLAAGPLGDARPLRLMAVAVFVVTTAMLADSYLFGGLLWDGLSGRAA